MCQGAPERRCPALPPRWPPTTLVGEASTSFVESQLTDEPGLVQMVRLELSGPLVGDIAEVLARLDQQLGAAMLIEISVHPAAARWTSWPRATC